MILLLLLAALGIAAIAGVIHLVHVDGYRRQPTRSAWQSESFFGSH